MFVPAIAVMDMGSDGNAPTYTRLNIFEGL